MISYMAGIFDTEGSVTINKDTSRFAIQMCDREPLGPFADKFGGKIHLYHPKNRNPIYQWKIVGEQMQATRILIPSLRIRRKKEALRLAIEWCRTKDKSSRRFIKKNFDSLERDLIPSHPIPEELDWEYLAGVWDGDGCSTILKQREGFGETSPNLVLEMCDREIVDLFKCAGGRIRRSGKILPVHHSRSFRWEMTGKNIIPIAERLLPLMKIPRKKKALACVLECAKLASIRGRARHGVPHHILRQRAELREKCILLNKRGSEKIDHETISVEIESNKQLQLLG